MEPRPHEDVSDSEDDSDYVPPDQDGGSSDEERLDTKRLRTSSQDPPEKELEEKKKTREALWEQFKTSASTLTAVAAPKTVKIEKRYRFAGEDITEVKEVPEDSEEAKKWPRWSEPSNFSQDGISAGPSVPLENAKDHDSASVISTSPSTPGLGLAASAAKPTKRPGPRKSKITLPPLPGRQKTKKLTTLDKSAMDWRSHVDADAEPIKDELEANRRGGGYLEKVEFLQRVADRKEDALEASKSRKRRR